MSMQAREQLVKRLYFQRDSQRQDLLNDSPTTGTKTELIALLLEITEHYNLGITAVRTDHHDDSSLGLHCHYNGYAVDCWPTHTAGKDDWLDANDPTFGLFLEYAAGSPWLYQIGLAGSADTHENRQDAGATVFEDDGGDHVHFGAI